MCTPILVTICNTLMNARMSKLIRVSAKNGSSKQEMRHSPAPGLDPALETVLWNFHELLDRDEGAISKWIRSARWSAKTRANFDRSLDQLKHLPKQHWSKPNPASKIGNHTYVIRFRDVTSTQLRVFGHFHDAHSAFTMTFEGVEKDDEYHPKNYEDVAEAHRSTCNRNFDASTCAFEQRCEPCNELHRGKVLPQTSRSICSRKAP